MTQVFSATVYTHPHLHTQVWANSEQGYQVCIHIHIGFQQAKTKHVYPMTLISQKFEPFINVDSGFHIQIYQWGQVGRFISIRDIS